MRLWHLVLSTALLHACAGDPAPSTDVPTDGSGDATTPDDTDALRPGETSDPDDTDTSPGDTDTGPADTDNGPGDTDADTDTDTGPGDTNPPDTDTDPADTDTGDTGPGDTDTGPGDTDTDTGPGDTDTADTDTDGPPPPCFGEEREWTLRTPAGAAIPPSSLPASPSWQPLPGDADSFYLDAAAGVTLTLPAHPSLQPVEEGTIEAWVWVDEAGDIFTTNAGNPLIPGLRLGVTAQGAVELEAHTDMISAVGGLTPTTGSGAMPFGTWTHLAAVVSKPTALQTQLTVYINGGPGLNQQLDGTIQHAPGTAPQVGSPTAPFTGKVAQLRAWRHAMPASAVRGRHDDMAPRFGRSALGGDPPKTSPSYELLPRRCDVSAPLPQAYAPTFDEDTCLWDPYTWRSVAPTFHEATVVDHRSDPVWVPFVDNIGALRIAPDRHVELPMPLSITQSVPFTIETWLRLPTQLDATHTGPILSSRTSASSSAGHHLSVDLDDGFVYTIETAGGLVELSSGPQALLPGAWQQLAIRVDFDQGSFDYALFVDGRLVDNHLGASANVPAQPRFRLGLPDASFTGDVAFLRAWNDALTPSDLRSSFNSSAELLERLPGSFAPAPFARPVNEWWLRLCGEPATPCLAPPQPDALVNTSPAGAAYNAMATTPLTWRGNEEWGQFAEIKPMTFASDPVLNAPSATVSLWVRPDVDAPSSYLLTSEGAQAPFSGLSLSLAGIDPSSGEAAIPGDPFVEPGELLQWQAHVNGVNIPGPIALLGQWQHIGLTLGTTSALYVDGVLVGSDTTGSLSSSGSAQLAIGLPGDPGLTLQGLIGRIDLWSSALNADEVATTRFVHAGNHGISLAFPPNYTSPSTSAAATYRIPFCITP